MNTFINFNGKIMRSDLPVIHADNRGFRYGDGIFETLRVKDGKIVLADFHFDRLFSGIQLLQFERPPSFTIEKISLQIEELCRESHHLPCARVRLVVFRSNGAPEADLVDYPDYLIQTSPLPAIEPKLAEKGMLVGMYPGGRKAIDLFSNLKSNNCLVNVMAAKYAKVNRWNDCLLMNSKERICETTIANIFCIKDEFIHTPPLSEGCVAGVTRRYLLQKLSEMKYALKESQMDIEFLKSSDEIFLTNSIYGIRSLEQLEDRRFSKIITSHLYQNFISNTF